jgi:hypothetical protein
MGRQISFFLALQDVEDLLSFIAERGDRLLSGTSAPILGFGQELKSQFLEEGFGFQTYIWNDQLKKPTLGKRSGQIMDSEVVEYLSGSCDVEAKRMLPGRFYIDMFYVKDDEILRKSDKLNEFYDVYKRHIVRTFRKSADRGYYIGPKAYELCHTGWKTMAGELVEIPF